MLRQFKQVFLAGNWLVASFLALTPCLAASSDDLPSVIKYRLTQPEDMSEEQRRNLHGLGEVGGGGTLVFDSAMFGLSANAKEKLARALSIRSSWTYPEKSLYCNHGFLIVASVPSFNESTRVKDKKTLVRVSSIVNWMKNHGYDESLIVWNFRKINSPDQVNSVDYDFLDSWLPLAECNREKATERLLMARWRVKVPLQ